MDRKKVISLILLLAAIVYDVLPIDLIPDVPVLGWLDDAFLTSAAAVNCFEQFVGNDNETAQKVLMWVKWIFFMLAVLVVLFALLLITGIVLLFK